ncbi:MAG: hypothetical protein COA73_16910, partial [Candidatus Hydrogenedentota bacterium]
DLSFIRADMVVSTDNIKRYLGKVVRFLIGAKDKMSNSGKLIVSTEPFSVKVQKFFRSKPKASDLEAFSDIGFEEALVPLDEILIPFDERVPIDI